MNEAYERLKQIIEGLSENEFDLEDIIGALHILQIQCETTLRIKLVQSMTKDEDESN